MQVSPYLNFNGDCREAFEFYSRATGCPTLAMMTFGDAPGDFPMPPDWKDKIIHARILIGQTMLMGSDAPPGRQSTLGGFGVSLNVDTDADAERILKALSEGGEVTMPMGETFFATRFGMAKDKFGVMWMVVHEKPMGGQ